MLAVIVQELYFCESSVNEYAKLPCCTSQMELFLKEFKLKMVCIVDVTPGKPIFTFMASTSQTHIPVAVYLL